MVPATEVRLIVIANLMLNPPLVYILKHTQVQYKVELVKQGKTQGKNNDDNSGDNINDNNYNNNDDNFNNDYNKNDNNDDKA